MSPAPTPRSRADGAPHRGALQIHLVDDDFAFALGLSCELEERGVVVRVSDGRSTIDRVAEERPDLIVLCAELPDVSGYAICSSLKRDRRLASIPLVLTSEEAGPETFEAHRRLSVRAEEYLRKPFDAATLMALAARLVGERPGAFPAPLARAPGGVEALEEGFELLGDDVEQVVLEECPDAEEDDPPAAPVLDLRAGAGDLGPPWDGRPEEADEEERRELDETLERILRGDPAGRRGKGR